MHKSSTENVVVELWYLQNSVREFSILNENLLGSPEAFWRPCVNLSLLVGEDSLEEGAFLPWGNPNNKEQMTINKVEHGSLLSWILTLIPQRGPYPFL